MFWDGCRGKERCCVWVELLDRRAAVGWVFRDIWTELEVILSIKRFRQVVPQSMILQWVVASNVRRRRRRTGNWASWITGTVEVRRGECWGSRYLTLTEWRRILLIVVINVWVLHYATCIVKSSESEIVPGMFMLRRWCDNSSRTTRALEFLFGRTRLLDYWVKKCLWIQYLWIGMHACFFQIRGRSGGWLGRRYQGG